MAAASDPAKAPVFISYSRRDYYFAESLALSLLKEHIPAWLDVKDLTPGVFWERDLFAALDAAACVVIVASKESVSSPNVRQEIERARAQRKRIIVARFRGVSLPDTLRDCEQVDFRGSFTAGLREMVSVLHAPASSQPTVRGPKLLRAPAWVLAIALILAVPTIVFIALADWGDLSKIANFAMVTAVALGVAWVATISFLQRKMGMTRLAIFLLVLSGVFAVPILTYVRRGQAGLQGEATNIAGAISRHTVAMSLLASIPLLGLGLIVLARPYDLLRWTPTGRAWHWYRHRCASCLVETRAPHAATAGERFFLLYDPVDQKAAESVRQELARAGWQEDTPNANAKAVLLLTNRTGSDWLLAEQPQLAGDVLTIVATSITLPSQLEWLWKREWIDFRGWDLTLPQFAQSLPLVPEAVTQPRFPASVRFANHMLCALTALAFVLMALANPQAMSNSQQPPPAQMLSLTAGFALVVVGIEAARRLLRRSITERGFYRCAWAVWVASLIFAVAAWMEGIAPPAELRIVPVAIFLAGFSLALVRNRNSLAFWFPTSPLRSKNKTRTLAGKRIWRTFWWLFGYGLLWQWMLNAFK